MNKHEQWIEQLENSSHIGILVVDRERNNLFVNSHLCEMFGYDKEFLLQNTSDIFHVNHDSFLKFAELAFDAVLAGTPLEIDYQLKRQDGSLFWAHISGDPIESNKEILWTLVDISSRISAEKEIVYQYNMLDSAINTTPDLIFYKDYFNEDGKYIGCNDAFASFVGKSKDSVVGHTDLELFGEEVGNFFRTKDKEMLAKGKTVENEEWVDHPNKGRVLLNTSKTPFHDSDNNIVGVVGISRDITEMYNSNESIKKLSERSELALLGNNDGVWDWNLLNNEVYYSARWKEMLGYRDDELPNEFSTWEELVHPEDKDMVLSEVYKNIEGKSEYVNVYHRLKHKDGHWVWIHDRSKAIYDNAKAVRMIGTHTDVSEEKEIQLKYAQQAQIIQQIHDCVISTNMQGAIESFNHGAELMLGYSPDEIIGQHIAKIHLEEDHKLLDKYIGFLKKEGEFNTEIRLVKKSGQVIDTDLSLSLLRDEKGKPTGMVGYSQDITIRKKAQDELREQHKYLQSIIDGIDDPIMVIKEDYTIELMNATLQKSMHRVNIADINSPKCYEISHNRTTPCDGFDHPCPLRDVLDLEKHTTVIHNHHTKDGDNRYVELSASPLFDKKKNCIGIIESARDITNHLITQSELVEQKNILSYQAHHDYLTSLPNRVLFNDRLEQAIEKSKRNNLQFALLFIDLDHFKEINDSLGHAVGDEILKIVTTRLRATVRDKDTVSRLGGDEFTIILEDLHETQGASTTAGKILKVLSQVMNVNDKMLYVSSSIGISIFPDDSSSSQNLLKYADSAMYKAKAEGRNNFQYYNPIMTELALERVEMQTSLRDALQKEELVVYYQAQVNGATNRLIGLEALVRWQHPTKGMIFPDKFIPLAESTGMIVQLDRYVMKTAMRQFAKWHKDGLNPGILAMNLAIKQLQQKDFIEMLKNLIKETGCKAEWIEFEVTESQIMTNPLEAIKQLDQISNLGIELAVDDFGTGYSSLAYLKRLPIDKLKIDKAFVQDLPDDEEDVGITKAVIALAKSLNLRVIAEGVETQVQRDFLVENGCKNIQGYYYSKPIASDEVQKILASKKFNNK